jgi:hypothetical protein
MKLKNIVFIGGLLVGSTPLMNQAEEVSFSIGGGYPFFVVPEVSLASNEGEQRWFANYKMGLDDGFSIGFEQGIDDNKHAVGVVAGALGVQDNNRSCSNNDLDENIGSEVGNQIGCAIAKAFNDKTTNGVGLSYSYNFNGLNNVGMRIRVEFGYGKASDSNEKRTDGGITISYQF